MLWCAHLGAEHARFVRMQHLLIRDSRDPFGARLRRVPDVAPGSPYARVKAALAAAHQPPHLRFVRASTVMGAAAADVGTSGTCTPRHYHAPPRDGADGSGAPPPPPRPDGVGDVGVGGAGPGAHEHWAGHFKAMPFTYDVSGDTSPASVASADVLLYYARDVSRAADAWTPRWLSALLPPVPSLSKAKSDRNRHSDR